MEIKNLVVGHLRTNCYLINSQGEILVVDPGGNGPHILENLEKMEGKVKYIVNTHEHYDHLKANDEVKEGSGGDIIGIPKEGDVINVGDLSFKVITTPGHSKESISLIGDGILFTGDILYNGRVGRTDLPGGSREELEDSLRKLEKGYLSPGIKIYPGHAEPFIWEEKMRMESYFIRPENYTQI